MGRDLIPFDEARKRVWGVRARIVLTAFLKSCSNIRCVEIQPMPELRRKPQGWSATSSSVLNVLLVNKPKLPRSSYFAVLLAGRRGVRWGLDHDWIVKDDLLNRRVQSRRECHGYPLGSVVWHMSDHDTVGKDDTSLAVDDHRTGGRQQHLGQAPGCDRVRRDCESIVAGAWVGKPQPHADPFAVFGFASKCRIARQREACLGDPGPGRLRSARVAHLPGRPRPSECLAVERDDCRPGQIALKSLGGERDDQVRRDVCFAPFDPNVQEA